MTPTFDPTFKSRPLSYSQLASWQWDKEQWYRRYVLGEKDPPNAAMLAGSEVGRRIAEGTSEIPVTRLSHFEYKLETVFDGMSLIGFIDSYEPHTRLLEYKTSANRNTWSQEKVDAHRQIDFYALIIFLKYGIKPQDIQFRLEYIPMVEKGDFSIEWTGENPIGWNTKRDIKSLLLFGNEIKKTVGEMESFAQMQLANEVK